MHPYYINTILIIDINIASITPCSTPKDLLALGAVCIAWIIRRSIHYSALRRHVSVRQSQSCLQESPTSLVLWVEREVEREVAEEVVEVVWVEAILLRCR